MDEASNFARWLEFSGVIQLLQAHSADVPLRVDGYDLANKLRELIQECGDWYSIHSRSNKPRDAYVSQSKLEQIEQRLAAIEYNLGLSRINSKEAEAIRVA